MKKDNSNSQYDTLREKRTTLVISQRQDGEKVNYESLVEDKANITQPQRSDSHPS